MNASTTPVNPRHTPAPGATMSTEEIKTRIAAMFTDDPPPTPDEPRPPRSA